MRALRSVLVDIALAFSLLLTDTSIRASTLVNHQWLENLLLKPIEQVRGPNAVVKKCERLGGLLGYHYSLAVGAFSTAYLDNAPLPRNGKAFILAGCSMRLGAAIGQDT
jgi:hypothetical protein